MNGVSRRGLLAGAAAVAALACSKQEDVVVKTGADKKLGEEQIDSDAVPLLPGGAIGVLYVDARALFASQFGDKLLGVVQRRTPLPASAGFDPKRDLDKLWLGFYSMSGADSAGVAVGSFDRQKIEAAADGQQQTPLGVPVTKSNYAGRTLFTAGEAGFSILTAKTALIGNDTGMRRALDRIEEGRVRRQIPAYMEKLLNTPGVPLVAGADFTSSPLPDAARQELAFLDGVKTLALVGNFESPGLNLAGTLTYSDPAAATRGAQNLVNLRSTLERYAPFLALLGFGQPVRKLEAQPKESEVAFVLGVDGAAVAALLDKAQDLLIRR